MSLQHCHARSTGLPCLVLYSYYNNNYIVAICTIEKIVGTLDEVQGCERGWMGSPRMEEQELPADVIKVQDQAPQSVTVQGLGPLTLKAKISVLGLSYPQYLRSAKGWFPFKSLCVVINL